MLKRVHPAIVGIVAIIVMSLIGLYIMRQSKGVPEGYLVTNDAGAIYIRERIIPTYMTVVGKDVTLANGKKANDTLVPLMQELQMINNAPDRWSSRGTEEERKRSLNTNYIEPLNKAIQEGKLTNPAPLPAFGYPGQSLQTPMEKEIEKGLTGIQTACKIEFDACAARGGRIVDCETDRRSCETRLAKTVAGEDPTCVKNYEQCKKGGKTEQVCTKEKETCQKMADERQRFYNSLVTQTNPTPSYDSLKIKTSINEGITNFCARNYTECIKTNSESKCSSEREECIKNFNRLVTPIDTALAASANQIEVSPELAKLLAQIQGTAAQAGPNTNLGLVDTGVSGLKEILSKYSPSQTTIAPHQIPKEEEKSYLPIQPLGQQIPVLSPSVRQQIRDDVAGVVRNELNNIGAENFQNMNRNEYEIQYTHM